MIFRGSCLAVLPAIDVRSARLCRSSSTRSTVVGDGDEIENQRRGHLEQTCVADVADVDVAQQSPRNRQ